MPQDSPLFPAGPELDALLAEKMGHKVCRKQDCEGCDCEWFYVETAGSWASHVNGVNYSRDPSAAIAACEEMREKGRIAHWSMESAFPGCVPAATVLPGDYEEMTQDVHATGSSPAHALCLALLEALW